MRVCQAHPKCRPVAGFTLMEMVMVLMIMGLLAGFMLFAYSELAEDQGLHEPSLKLQQLARRASRSSTAHDQPYRIRFEQDGFYVVAGLDEFNAEDVQGRYRLREKVEMELRRWQSEEWIVPDEAEWLFAANGLAEPISVRFTQGQGYIELDFNPMTGAVDERRSYLP